MAKRNSRAAKAARRQERAARGSGQSAAWLVELGELEDEGLAPGKLLLVGYDGAGNQWPLDPHRDMADAWHFRPGVRAKVVWKCECGSDSCGNWWEFHPDLGGSLRLAVAEAARAGRYMSGDRSVYGPDPDRHEIPPGLLLITDAATAALLEGDS